MALSAGTYQGRIGSRTYSMRRNWPVDNASMISDYGAVMVSGRRGVGCCGDDMVGVSGLGTAQPLWTTDPTQIIGYWTLTSGPMKGNTFVVTRQLDVSPEQAFGPGTFSATDPRTGKLAPGLAARAQRAGMVITAVGVATILGLAVFAMRG